MIFFINLFKILFIFWNDHHPRINIISRSFQENKNRFFFPCRKSNHVEDKPRKIWRRRRLQSGNNFCSSSTRQVRKLEIIMERRRSKFLHLWWHTRLHRIHTVLLLMLLGVSSSGDKKIVFNLGGIFDELHHQTFSKCLPAIKVSPLKLGVKLFKMGQPWYKTRAFF